MASTGLSRNTLLFKAAQYDSKVVKLLNKEAETSTTNTTDTGTAATTKTPAHNVEGVTFQCIRNQSNLIVAVFVWIGGHIARLFVPANPMNDEQAKKYLIPCFSFLGEHNEELTIGVVNTKIHQLARTKNAACKDLNNQIKSLNDLIGKYNDGKGDENKIPPLDKIAFWPTYVQFGQQSKDCQRMGNLMRLML